MSKTEIFENIKNKKIVELNVKTNSDRTELIIKDEKLILQIKALPEDGKANQEIIKYLHKNTGKNIKIISGMTSKHKLIRLE